MTSVWPQTMSRGHTKFGWKFPIITTEVSISNNFILHILPYCDFIFLETWCFIFLVVWGDLEEEFCAPMTSVWPQIMSRGHMKVVFIIYFSTLIFLYFLGIIYIEIMQENTSRNNFTQKCHCFESLNAGKYSRLSFMKHDFISTFTSCLIGTLFVWKHDSFYFWLLEET